MAPPTARTENTPVGASGLSLNPYAMYAEDDNTVSYDPDDGPFCGILQGIDDDGSAIVHLVPEDMPSAGQIANAGVGYKAAQSMADGPDLSINRYVKYYQIVGNGGPITIANDKRAGRD